MACLKAPVPPIPVLPSGITLPIFVPPTLPDLGLCCKLPLPAFPIPAIALPIAFPAAAIATVNGFLLAMQSYFDLLQVSCPLE